MNRFIICRLQFVKYYRGDPNDIDMWGGHVTEKTKKKPK